MRVMRGVARAREQIDGGGVLDLNGDRGGGIADAMRAEVYEGWLAEWGLRPENWSGYCGYGSIEARGDPSMRGRAGKEAWNLWGFTGSRESYWWAYDLLSPAYIDLAVKR